MPKSFKTQLVRAPAILVAALATVPRAGLGLASALAMTLVAALILGLAAPAGAAVSAGDPAPPFTKTRLGGGSVSLSDYSGQVVVLFLLGYG